MRLTMIENIQSHGHIYTNINGIIKATDFCLSLICVRDY